MIHAHMGLSGFTRWELLDNGQTIREGAHSNLILNSGLDAFATEAGGDTNGGTAPPYIDWRSYLSLGTGSAAPVATQTALSAPLAGARSINVGGFASEQIFTRSRVGGALQIVSRMVRVYDITSAVNLTEYGLSSGTANNLSVRELLRDGGGNPIAVSVQAGQQFKLIHDLTLTLPLSRTSSPVAITGAGVLAADATYWSNADGSSNADLWLSRMCAPASAANMRQLTAQDNLSATGGTPVNNGADTATVLQPYTAGTYQRSRRVVLEPGTMTANHWGWMLISMGGNSGWKVALGAALNKSASQRLTLDFITSWARV